MGTLLHFVKTTDKVLLKTSQFNNTANHISSFSLFHFQFHISNSTTYNLVKDIVAKIQEHKAIQKLKKTINVNTVCKYRTKNKDKL